jgi:hypothetical protein
LNLEPYQLQLLLLLLLLVVVPLLHWQQQNPRQESWRTGVVSFCLELAHCRCCCC